MIKFRRPADGTPRRDAIIAMPLVLTKDLNKRDELAEKITSCEPISWEALESEGYMVRIDALELNPKDKETEIFTKRRAELLGEDLCPVRDTVMFLACRDLSLLRDYIPYMHQYCTNIGASSSAQWQARLEDACVHAMHANVARALHGIENGLVDLSLMRRIFEEALGKDKWQEPLFTMMSKNCGPQQVFNRPPQDVGPLVTPPSYNTRSAAWRYVAQILWSPDRWETKFSGPAGLPTTWSRLLNSLKDDDKNFESFVQREEMIPSNVSFWLYYLMTTTRGKTDSTLDNDVRFLFNLQCRNCFGTGHEPRVHFMHSAIYAYIMLRRAHEKFESDCANFNRTFSCEHLIDDLGAEYNFHPVISFCMKSWSTVISLAWSYDGQRHDDYLWFLRAEMASWLKHKNTWTINDQSEYCNSWYSRTSRVIAPFIQGLEFTQTDEDAQKFGLQVLKDLFSVKEPCIDWDRLVSNFVYNYPQVMCYQEETKSEYASKILSGCTYEKFDKFINVINENFELSGEMRDNCMKLRMALGKHFNWGEDYMVVAKRAEKAEKLKRLRDSLDAYTEDGEDDPELKKMRLYLEQISC